MKVALLCNNSLALPAMKKLADDRKLHAIGVPDKLQDMVSLFTQTASRLSVPVTVFSKGAFKEQLNTWMQDVSPDVVLVMTFPWRIPAATLAMPPLGFINFHYGLLPQMRGADPIFESIRRRKPTAGLTVHVMDENFDTGDILFREEFPLQPGATYGMLGAQQAYLGEQICGRIIDQLQQGRPVAVPQSETDAAYYPAISPGELAISWKQMDSTDIIALVNSCNPVLRSGVSVYVNSWRIGICDASPVTLQGDPSQFQPGTILAADAQNGLLVMCRDGLAVKLDVVFAEEGLFPGHKLSFFGIKPGMAFS
jgi:methionyl-tRNA formyltransferase